MSCRRTARIVATVLDGRPLGISDRRHVASCARCSAALERLPDFEGAVGQAARTLVAEAEAAPVPERAPPPFAGGGRPPTRSRLLPSLAAVAAIVVVAAGAAFLATRPGPEAPPVAEALPVVETEAVAALTGLDFVCQETVLEPGASPPIEGSSCQRVSGGFQIGGALEQTTVDLRRSDAGIGRAVVTLKHVSVEIGQGPGNTASPTPEPLHPVQALAELTAIAAAILGEDHEAGVTAALQSMVDAEGRACSCETVTPAGRVRLDGDAGAGYVMSFGAGDEPLPPPPPPPPPVLPLSPSFLED